MDNIINISNVVNVTITSLPVGLGIPSVNNLAIFSEDQPSNSDPFRIYKSATDVETDYGTDSLTTKFAQNIFSQTPNLLSGDGRLIIFPLQSSVSATQGDVVTADISANLTALKAVSDGEFNITLNGVAEDILGLDFTNTSTLADVAAVIQAKLPNVVVSESGGQITFKSKQSGAISTIVIAAVSGGSGTDLTAAGLLNISAATTTDGVASSGETIQAAIARTESLANYCGILTTLVVEDTKIDAIATAVQSRDMIIGIPFADTTAIAGKATDIKDAGQFKTRCILYTEDIEAAQLMVAGYFGRAFSVNFNGSNTAQTMNLKQITNVTPDGGINQTLYEACKVAGMDVYVSYNGLPGVLSTAGNTYFDRVYNQQQFKFDIQVEGFNYLATTSTKIPQTEAGMDGLKDTYKDVGDKFVVNGFIGRGLTWSSADKFGDPEDFDRNITQRGFYIFSQPIAEQSQVDRDARKAPLVQMAIKEAGSIHESIINVFAEA